VALISELSEPPWLEGGCHCGQVRFRARPREPRALDCNCSICRKKGFLHLIVERRDFELSSGEEALTTYTFNTGVAQHRFCSRCGVHPFYIPRSHPEQVSVNLRCLDDDLLHEFQIVAFDGKNWEANVNQFR
jgi:hypothetical protein